MPEAPPLMAQAAVTVASDFVVWALPLPTLCATRLPLNQRVALLTVFSFGLLVVFAACMRAYWINHITENTYDVTWEGFELWIWTAVEVNLGIICGCVPTLNSLLKPRRRKSTATGSKPAMIIVSNLSKVEADPGNAIPLDDRNGAAQKNMGNGGGKQLGTPTDRYLDLESCSSSTVDARRSG